MERGCRLGTRRGVGMGRGRVESPDYLAHAGIFQLRTDLMRCTEPVVEMVEIPVPCTVPI